MKLPITKVIFLSNLNITASQKKLIFQNFEKLAKDLDFIS